MNHLFVPYQESLNLKNLGFNEPCFRCYDNTLLQDFRNFRVIAFTSGVVHNEYLSGGLISTPLYQQAFDWFREEHNIHHSIFYHKSSKFECRINDSSDNNLSQDLFGEMFETYEKAQLACLQELIKIVKNDNPKGKLL